MPIVPETPHQKQKHRVILQLGVGNQRFRGPSVDLETTLRELREGENPEWDRRTARYDQARAAALAAPDDADAALACKRAKEALPCLAPLISYTGEEAVPYEGLGIEHHNGLYVYDLDQHFPEPGAGGDDSERESKAMAVLEELQQPGSVACAGGLSATRAAWCIVWGPAAQSLEDLQHCHEYIRTQLLPAALEVVASGQSNPGRLRLVPSGRSSFYRGSTQVEVPDRPEAGAGVIRASGSGPTPSRPSGKAPASRDFLLKHGVIQDLTGHPELVVRLEETARAALATIPLPDESHPVWVKVASALAAGQDLYPDFHGDDLFLEWTGEQAYQGSTKRARAASTYAGIRGNRRGTRQLELLFTIAKEDYGWDGKTPEVPPEAPAPPSESADPQFSDGWEPASIPDWPTVGRWIASVLELNRTWRYDARRTEWHRWENSSHWVFASATSRGLPTELDDLIEKQRDRLQRDLNVLSVPKADGKAQLALTDDTLSKRLTHGIGAGLRAALRRDFPNYPNDAAAQDYRRTHLAVPSGVIDLRTGEKVPHDPLVHDTTAVTTGDYRPEELERLTRLLRARMAVVLDDDEEFLGLVGMLGVMGSGKSQDYRALLVFHGGSGTGKGGTLKLVMRSLGERGITLSPSFLADHGGGEISIIRYELMRRQPLAIGIDELGADSRVNMPSLLGLSGSAILPAARLPYMRDLYQDTISSLVILSMVDPPRMPRGSGLERRLYVIPCHLVIPSDDKDDAAAYPQDLMDAVITVMADAAVQTFCGDWTKPEPSPKAMDAFLAGADELADWLDQLDGDEWHLQPFRNLVQAAQEEFGKADVDEGKLGRKIRKSDRWVKCKRKGPKGEPKMPRIRLLGQG